MLKIKHLGLLVILGLSLIPQQASAQSNAIVEDAVRFAFADIPVMIDIARCESRFRQFGPDGNALRGGTAGKYIGIFQIGEALHAARAASMGFDIYSIDGNMGYARYMYNNSGTNPWRACIPASATPSVVQTSVSVSVSGSIIMNLNPGMTNQQVKILQQILNRSGFVITNSGGGSPGNETLFFGSLTREALRRFQCAKGIVCEGNESTTGYGRVGPKTRAALNSL